MASFLSRIGSFSYRARWYVLIAWMVILGLLGGGALLFGKGMSDTFTIPGAPSAHAQELYEEVFPDATDPFDSPDVTMVFKAPEGSTLRDEAVSATVDEIIDSITNSGMILESEQFGNPVTVADAMKPVVVAEAVKGGSTEEAALEDLAYITFLSPDETVGTATFTLTADNSMAVTDEQREMVESAAQIGRDAGLQVEMGGQGFAAPIDIEATAEIIGIGLAAVILAITFGALATAGLPLSVALIGVGIGYMGTLLVTAFVDVNSVTPALSVMLGLAVGIDYSLFIIARFRSELLSGKHSYLTAAGIATGTAGSAVVFAGLTVIIALVALSVVGIPFLTVMGMSAAFTVLIAVLLAITLTPALLGILGSKVFAGRLKFIKAPDPEDPEPTMGLRWVRLVRRFPVLFLLAAVLLLGTLSLPTTKLELGLPSDGTADHGTTQREANDLKAEAFGEGKNSPLLVIADAREVSVDNAYLQPLADGVAGTEAGAEVTRQQQVNLAAFSHVSSTFKRIEHVANVQIVGINNDGTAAQLLITPTGGPYDQDTLDLIEAVRDISPLIEADTGLNLGVTGLTAIQADVTKQLADALPMYLALVVGLALVLLIIVFRSLLVPLVAALGFLLSVGTSFGLTVGFWQLGWFGIVPTPGPLISFMPIFLVGITFGLAMDYQVFLVSRMREGFTHGKTAGNATANGFKHSARVVTAAAIIMVAVFAAFIAQPLPFIKVIGFALAVGVAADAFIVRMTMVPATMYILGSAAWWCPRWLLKILPRVDIEGEHLDTTALAARNAHFDATHPHLSAAAVKR